MNRRGFFHRLALLSTAVLVTPLLKPKSAVAQIQGPVFPYELHDGKAILNPEWVRAPYEIVFKPFIHVRRVSRTIPFRFRTYADAQDFMSRQAWKTDSRFAIDLKPEIGDCSPA